MIKKMFVGLIVFTLLFGLSKEINAGENKEKSITSKSKSKVTTKQAKRLDVGTPTVQQLLDKVKDNYGKIRDLKADYTVKVRDAGLAKYLGILGDLVTQNEKFYFKSPDKLKWIPPYKLKTVVMKSNVEYRRVGTGLLFKVTEDTPVKAMNRPWYTLLDPDRFDFYWRMDDIITKFDSRVISHPETNVWIIEAVPKASNPEIDPCENYNYPTPGWLKYELTVDFNKGVFTKITDIGIKSGNISSTAELNNFELINNTWIPTKLVKTVEGTEEYTLSNIQINTGISDSEFEF